MSAKLLTEHHLEFLSLKGGCTCSSESTLVRMSHCWKSHVTGQMCLLFPTVYSSLLMNHDIKHVLLIIVSYYDPLPTE